MCQDLWNLLRAQFKRCSGEDLDTSLQCIILGQTDSKAVILSSNFLLLLTKYFIYTCRVNELKPTFNSLLSFIKSKYNVRVNAGFSRLYRPLRKRLGARVYAQDCGIVRGTRASKFNITWRMKETLAN